MLKLFTNNTMILKNILFSDRKQKIPIFIILLIVPVSCTILGEKSGLVVQKEPVPNFIEYFTTGKQAYDEGDLENAVQALEQSLEINPDYTPAAEILGYTLMSMGEYEDALRQFSTVLTHNSYSINARLGIGRIYLIRKEFERSVNEYDIVIRVDAAHADAHFYRGMALRQQGKEYLSWTSFIRSIVHDGTYRSTVAGLIPLTEPHIANLFNKEYLAIEFKTAINRAEMAALLVSIITENRVYMTDEPVGGFQTPQMYELSEQPGTIPDVSDDYWAKNPIHKAVAAGLIEIFPDNIYKPEEQLSKIDFTNILQNLLVRKLNEPDLATRYFGKGEPFKDLNSSHWAYNAARLAVEFHLIRPREPDIFGLNDPVAAKTAISSLEHIKKIM